MHETEIVILLIAKISTFWLPSSSTKSSSSILQQFSEHAEADLYLYLTNNQQPNICSTISESSGNIIWPFSLLVKFSIGSPNSSVKVVRNTLIICSICMCNFAWLYLQHFSNNMHCSTSMIVTHISLHWY